MATRATYGMTVKLTDLGNQTDQVYLLVRVEEENWGEHKISMYHPIGKVLFTAVAGDIVDVLQKDGSVRKFRVASIEPT